VNIAGGKLIQRKRRLVSPLPNIMIRSC